MLRQHLLRASPWPNRPLCLLCAARTQPSPFQTRPLSASAPLSKNLPKKKAPKKARKRPSKDASKEKSLISYHVSTNTAESAEREQKHKSSPVKKTKAKATKDDAEDIGDNEKKSRRRRRDDNLKAKEEARKEAEQNDRPLSLRDALLGAEGAEDDKARRKRAEQLHIQELDPNDLTFEPIAVDIPPVPMLSYGLDRVLFNPGVYRLQDPRSRIYNFDPYLEKIMPVSEFNFDALSEYKTSSKDETLLALTERLGTKFTGSTSSMSGILQHFHFLLSNFRHLNHMMLSRGFPNPSNRFSKITFGPDAIFLRYKKDGVYAIDADKTYDTPNIMSWLGHSLEKLLTTHRDEFELFRRSSSEQPPAEDDSSRCYHYSKQGNLLMRSQLDAQDPRLPGTGVFDLKTRAVVSIRMHHQAYETGSGYQLRYDHGEWESFEREFYDMTRATMLKYSLQVRMGRMDGIFLAYHNIERIFGFQYLSRADMDRVLHGQASTELGDQEFKLSLALLDEMLVKATEQYPGTSIRLHFEARDSKESFMYIFAEPVTEEEAEEIQSRGAEAQKEFTRNVVGIGKDDDKVQEDTVDAQIDTKGSDKAVEHVESESQAEQLRESDQDEDGKLTKSEHEETEQVEELASEESTGEADIEESPDDIATGKFPAAKGSTDDIASRGPLMGWTLTVRSQVNGGYVHRPTSFGEEDEWKLEYNVQEIPEGSRWRLYDALTERRRGNIGRHDEEVDQSLKLYRALIKRYSERGRAWREEQDKLNEKLGKETYKPLGPGSDGVRPIADKEQLSD